MNEHTIDMQNLKHSNRTDFHVQHTITMPTMNDFVMYPNTPIQEQSVLPFVCRMTLK